MKNTLDGGDAILEAIRDLGVKHILFFPGHGVVLDMGSDGQSGHPGQGWSKFHGLLARDARCRHSLPATRSQRGKCKPFCCMPVQDCCKE